MIGKIYHSIDDLAADETARMEKEIQALCELPIDGNAGIPVIEETEEDHG